MNKMIARICFCMVFVFQALSAGAEDQNAIVDMIELKGSLPKQEQFKLRVEVQSVGVEEINTRNKLLQLYGVNQTSSNPSQRVVSKIELLINGIAVAFPESAFMDLFDPSFAYTLRVLSSGGDVVIAFAGGSGEREYGCRLYIRNGRCSLREIRMLDNHAQEVVYSKQL